MYNCCNYMCYTPSCYNESSICEHGGPCVPSKCCIPSIRTVYMEREFRVGSAEYDLLGHKFASPKSQYKRITKNGSKSEACEETCGKAISDKVKMIMDKLDSMENNLLAQFEAISSRLGIIESSLEKDSDSLDNVLGAFDNITRASGVSTRSTISGRRSTRFSRPSIRSSINSRRSSRFRSSRFGKDEMLENKSTETSDDNLSDDSVELLSKINFANASISINVDSQTDLKDFARDAKVPQFTAFYPSKFVHIPLNDMVVVKDKGEIKIKVNVGEQRDDEEKGESEDESKTHHL